MTNMIQSAREQVAVLTQAAYQAAAASGALPAGGEAVRAQHAGAEAVSGWNGSFPLLPELGLKGSDS